jgi:nitroreductase
MSRAMNSTELLATLNWRYATKRFDPAQRIDAATWDALEESLVLTPSSYGLQPWKFLVITDPALRAQLQPRSWNQTQVTECSHYVVFLGRTGLDTADIDRLIQSTATVRGVPAESIAGYRTMMIGDLIKGPRSQVITEWATRQVYIALGQFMASCAMLRVDACPMEGIDPAAYDEILGLAGSGYATRVACAAGYRAAGDKYATAKKVRFPRSEVVSRK